LLRGGHLLDLIARQNLERPRRRRRFFFKDISQLRDEDVTPLQNLTAEG
jgi:hypothetical protein